VLSLLISHTLANPLANLARSARAFASHDWHRRVKVTGAGEIADVARAFNEMADALEQAETQRRNLMADVAHDLRTPLTVMQGNLQALLDGVYPLDNTEIASLYDETRLLSRLVDDIRELALADAGQLPLAIQTVDAEAVLRTAAANFGLAAESQEARIVLDIAANLPKVRADADRLAQVLRNLLTNALRHAPGSRITLSGHLRPATAGQGEVVCIAVSDTGQGIPADELPHVFDRFYRGDQSRAQASGGIGLGLAIARTWVEAMHGEIGVESEPGQGSRFWFTLPVATGEKSTLDRPKE
jgi:two-component system OmpR family sensor kinase